MPSYTSEVKHKQTEYKTKIILWSKKLQEEVWKILTDVAKDHSEAQEQTGSDEAQN